ncbi:hypothetical protein QFC20_002614 [Naganishia adeliensis]|uniref:Uncharacterized protein n=1 Tax=Naganishia adeliensis TaxID=92952 RepID=A0ACC2WHT8_9TREE|nr:hypothetical protein QFC20_002614 [Naganishia adeliensis]
MGKTHGRIVLDQHDFSVAPKMPKYLRERSDYDAIPTTHIYKYTPDSQHKIEIPFLDAQHSYERSLEEQRAMEERQQRRQRKNKRQCLVCRKVLKSAGGLEEHTRVKHGNTQSDEAQRDKPSMDKHCPERRMVAASVISPTNENIPPHFVAYDPHLGSLGALCRHQVRCSPVWVSEVSGDGKSGK